MRKTIVLTIFIVSVYVIIELVSYTSLTILAHKFDMTYYTSDSLSNEHRNILNRLLNGESTYMEFDPVLGWTNKSNGEIQSNCSSGIMKSNSSGIRSDREYDLIPPEGVLRIAAFGDSFTHCEDVDNDDTWEALMESSTTGLEVLNFGVAGYGLDQAYLRYLKDGVKYEPDVVFIGFMTEDILRHTNNFRPFFNRSTGVPLSKPRYRIKDGGLVLIPNPISSLEDYRKLLDDTSAFLNNLGHGDYYYSRGYKSGLYDISPTVRLIKLAAAEIRRGIERNDNHFDRKSESYFITIRIFDAVYNDAIKNNSIPVILIFPRHEDIAQYKNFHTKKYSPLLAYFESKGYRYVDLMDALSDFEGDKEWNDRCGHYSPYENRLVAEHLLDYLRKNNLIE